VRRALVAKVRRGTERGFHEPGTSEFRARRVRRLARILIGRGTPAESALADTTQRPRIPPVCEGGTTLAETRHAGRIPTDFHHGLLGALSQEHFTMLRVSRCLPAVTDARPQPPSKQGSLTDLRRRRRDPTTRVSRAGCRIEQHDSRYCRGTAEEGRAPAVWIVRSPG
jgi:hypothetical protein